MGRRIPVIASPECERELEALLRSCGELRLFRVFASSREALEIATLADANTDSMVFAWFVRFPWSPTYARTQTDDRLTYINNRAVAPILEYSRADSQRGDSGRLYWSDRFCGEPAYDRAAFGRIVDRIWRWVRKRGSRLPGRHGAWKLD